MRRIYLVDDESVLRTLGRLLRIEGFDVLSFESPNVFLRTLGQTSTTGCVIADLKMPEMTGIEMYQLMESRECNLPIIFLTGHAAVSDTVLAMKHGAVNFLTKPATREDLLAALEEAFGIQDARAQEDSQDTEYRRRFISLTPREKEVCLDVIQGMMNKEIGGALGTSEKTIKIHRSRVMKKMKAGSVPDLVRMVDRVQNRSRWKTASKNSSPQ